MSDTPRTDAECISIEIDWRDYEYVKSSVSRQLERELNVANSRITTLQTQLDQRWELMRALELECGTKDVAEAVKFIRVLKARVSELVKAGDVMQKAVIGTEGQSHWQSLAEAHLADLIWRKAKGEK